MRIKLTKNFGLWEAESKDGAKMPDDVFDNVVLHSVHIQKIRNIVGKLTVNSWYRSPSHNKAVGGAENSWHLTGLATDLKPEESSVDELFDTIVNLIESGEIPEGGLSKYDTFVHYDSRGKKARW